MKTFKMRQSRDGVMTENTIKFDVRQIIQGDLKALRDLLLNALEYIGKLEKEKK